MTKYRTRPPATRGDTFLTDGGIETTLIFQEGIDLPLFAAFDLLEARTAGKSFRRTTTPTSRWRATRHRLRPREPDLACESRWAGELGYDTDPLERSTVRDRAPGRSCEPGETGHADRHQRRYRTAGRRLQPRELLSAESRGLSLDSDRNLRRDGADMVTALTMTALEEAIGIARAAGRRGFPPRSRSRSRPTAGCPTARRSGGDRDGGRRDRGHAATS